MQSDERCEKIKAEIESRISKDAGLDKNFWEGFWSGTIWADENPDCGYHKKCDDLEAKLSIAVEALEQYCGIPGKDCEKSTTKWSAADEALEKIKDNE